MEKVAKKQSKKNKRRSSAMETGSQPPNNQVYPEIKKLCTQVASKTGLVTSDGRQLSTNEEPQLRLAKALQQPHHGNDAESKKSPVPQTLKKGTQKKKGQKGSQHNIADGLQPQKTIPLNFLEDLKQGFDDDNIGEDLEDIRDKWFQDSNFSVIYKNQNIEKEAGLNLDGDFSLPSISDHRNSPHGVHQQRQFNIDEEVQSPLANDMFGPGDDLFPKKKKEAVEKKSARSKRRGSQTMQEIDTMQDYGVLSTKANFHTKNMDSEGDRLKPSGLINLKKQKGVNLQNKSEDFRQRIQLNFNSKLSEEKNSTFKNSNLNVLENDCDFSEIRKQFDVDFNQKLSLDDKRAKMFIINNLMAATNQGQVMDNSFFMIVEKDSLERIDDFSGRCLKLRKLIWKFKTHTTHLASFIISSFVFDAITLAVILCNSFVLAISDPTTDEQAPLLTVIDNIFLAFYTFEMTIKILGMGFFWNKNSYLRDPWNILDFVIVQTGYLSLFMSGSKLNLGGLRSFRVLRPLKTITNIEGLKKLVVALLSSVSQLRDSFIVLYFFYLIFSIAGLQLFLGLFKKRCFNIETGVIHPDEELCGVKECPFGYFCGKSNSNPYFEINNFDTIFYSFIAIYQCVSLEGWTQTMKQTMITYTVWAWILFIPMTFIVPYFLLQFTQAVISNAFQKQHTKEDDGKASKKKKRKALQDFENLDETEREKLLKEQDLARKKVLKKWRMIMFIKKQMRRVVKNYKDRKRVEEEQHQQQASLRTSIGFKNFISKQFQEKYLNSKQLGLETIVDHDPEKDSSRMLIERETTDLPRKLGEQTMKFESIFGVQSVQSPLARSPKRNENVTLEDVDGGGEEPKKRIQQNLGLFKKYQDRPGTNYDQHFFDEFVNEQLVFLEKQFTDEQLRNIAIEFDGQEFLRDLDNEELGEEQLSERIVVDKNAGRDCPTIVSDDGEMSFFEDVGRTNLYSQMMAIGSPIVVEKQEALDVVMPLEKNESTMDEKKKRFHRRKTSSIDQTKSPKRHYERSKTKGRPAKIETKPTHLQVHNEELKSQSPLRSPLKSPLKSPRGLSLTANRVVPYSYKASQHRYESKNKSKFFGTKTIQNRDYINPDESIFNNKVLVQDDVGKNKKIYIRKDKLDFQRQIDDIFEEREKLKKEVLQEQIYKDSIDYLAGIKLRPFERKCQMSGKQTNLTEDQAEALTSMQLELMDLESEIQKQYNKQFISELYVTGTLSIVLGMRKEEGKQDSIRKLQSNDVIEEEHENQVLLQMVKQHLQFLNLSRSVHCMSILMDRSSFNATSGADSAVRSKSALSRTSNAGNNNSALRRRKSIAPTSKKASKGATQTENTNDGNRKERFLNKQAAKDQNFQKKLIIKRINKDATRSTLFRESVIKRKQTKKNVSGDDVKDSDEDEDKEEEEEEGEIDDDFHDLDFHCDAEIFKSKKAALSKKISSAEWSGQDVLIDYDPTEAKKTMEQIGKVRIWRKGFLRYVKKTRWVIKAFILSTVMDNFLTFCVFSNTICLALDRYGIDPNMENFLTWANTVFTYIFISELALKLLGMGPYKYVKETMNLLDGGIVLLSIVELSLQSDGSAISAFRSIRIFRTFRVLRITRLLRSMKDMQIILNALMNSLNSLMYLYMLVFLSIFIFALLGMQIFGGNMYFEDNQDDYPGVPRQNYDDIFWSFTVCFQLLTQENWQVVLFDTLRSSVNKGLTMIYHISWMTVGNTILLNLLMGIMLDSMAEEEEHEEKNQEKVKEKHLSTMKSLEGQELVQHFQQLQQEEKSRGNSLNKKKKRKQKKADNILEESFEFDEDLFNQGANFNLTKKKKKDFEGNECTLSFYLFAKSNPFRIFLYHVQGNFGFEMFIQVLIGLSSVKLILDGYTKDFDEDSLLIKISEGSDYFFTAIFALESLIKSIALGFVMDKGTYLRESWNKLDFFIVITSLIDASFASVDIPFIRILRLLRTLRPLRVISHSSEMKTIIVALIHSVGGIFYVGILLLLVWIMFAILAVNLIGGKLYSCDFDPYFYFTQEQCEKNGHQWVNQYFNYDNVAVALVSLFDVATMENWPDQRNAAMDMSEQGRGPIRNNSIVYSYFFMIFILIGTYIFLNLFIGVIFIKFGDAQKEEEEATHLNPDQLRWVDMVKMVVAAKPDLETTNIPDNKFRKKMHQIVTGAFYRYKPDQDKKLNRFEVIIMICIVLNMFQMCVTFEGSSASITSITDYINYFFTAVFIVEAVMKLIAFGLSYFKDSWNLFDFFVVCASLLDITLAFLDQATISFLQVGPQLAKVLRVLRVSRLFRLIKKYRGLNALMETIQYSLPAMMNVFALLLLVYFIFSILAYSLFNEVTEGQIIDEYINFKNFGNSMMTLISLSTGEDWNYVMQDCSYTDADGCIPGKTCGSSYSIIFFVMFETMQGFIMLNLFILVTIQQFEKYYLRSNNVLQKFKDNLVLFKDMWTYYTIEDKCEKIGGNKVVRFFFELGQLIHVKQYKDTKLVTYFNEISSSQQTKVEDYKAITAKKEEEKKLKLEEEEEGLEEGEQKQDETKKRTVIDMNAMDQITKVIVRMDLEADGEGYVYFNELLFKTMKMVFGEQHLKNTILVDAEYRALKKIYEIKEKHLRKQRAEDRKQAMTVNPFVLKMFKHISFKTWIKLYNENMDRRDQQKMDKGDFEVSEADIEREDSKLECANEHEEFYYETEQDISCDDEGKEESREGIEGPSEERKEGEDEEEDEEEGEEEMEEEEEEEEEAEEEQSEDRPEGILKQ